MPRSRSVLPTSSATSACGTPWPSLDSDPKWDWAGLTSAVGRRDADGSRVLVDSGRAAAVRRRAHAVAGSRCARAPCRRRPLALQRLPHQAAPRSRRPRARRDLRGVVGAGRAQLPRAGPVPRPGVPAQRGFSRWRSVQWTVARWNRMFADGLSRGSSQSLSSPLTPTRPGRQRYRHWSSRQQGGHPLCGRLLRPLDDQLAARGTNVATAALSHRDGDAAVRKQPRERVDALVRRPRKRDARRLVERDEVHLRAQTGQEFHEPPGVGIGVVHAAQQHVLERDALPPLDREPRARRRRDRPGRTCGSRAPTGRACPRWWRGARSRGSACTARPPAARAPAGRRPSTASRGPRERRGLPSRPGSAAPTSCGRSCGAARPSPSGRC